MPAGAVVAATPVFAGTGGTAPGDAAEVTVTVYAGSPAAGTRVQTLAATRDQASGSFTVPAAFALADGTYTAQATQADDLGNTSTSAAVTFTVNSRAGAGGRAGSADQTAPVLRRVSLSKRRFPRAGKGTTVRFTITERATVTTRITRKGRQRTLGTLRTKARAGAGSLRFRGRLKSKYLAAGSYVMTLTAVDAAGNRSAPKRIPFRVLR